jgi:hypothetical protein
MTLYDLFGFSEEERKQLNTGKKKEACPGTGQACTTQFIFAARTGKNRTKRTKPHPGLSRIRRAERRT